MSTKAVSTSCCFLHIGTMKTGSSSVQNFLKRNAQGLQARGIVPLQSAVNPLRMNYISAALSTYCVPHNKKNFSEKLSRRLTDFSIRSIDEHIAFRESLEIKLRKEIGSGDDAAKKFIMSTESLSHRTDKEVAQIFNLLSSIFNEIKIVVYLRRQDSLLSSKYSTDLRQRGEVREINEYIKGMCHLSLLRYDVMLDRWASLFGEEAIVPRIWDRSELHRGDVVADFMLQIGVADLSSYEISTPSNVGLSAEMQELLRRVNLEQAKNRNESPSRVDQLPMIIDHLPDNYISVTGIGQRPTQDTALYVLERFGDSNENVRKRWFPERQELFSSDVSDLPLEPIAPEPILQSILTSLAKGCRCSTGQRVALNRKAG